MKPLFTVLLLLFGLVAVISILPSRKSRPKLNRDLEPKPLLTQNEMGFFNRLQRALPEHHVYPQVALGAILDTPKGLSYSQSRSLRNQFSQLIADYVICERDTLNIVAVVELDDRTHDSKKDKDAKRDGMIQSAGYRVIRFSSRAKPSEQEIAQHFNISQPKAATRQEPQF